MMPSIELRFGTMVRALTEVILPALPPENALAREQAQLLIAHLDLIAAQWPHADAYEARSLAEMAALAEQLATGADGGSATRNAAEELRLCVHDGASQAAGERRAAIAAAIDKLVNACGRDGSAAFRADLSNAILEYTANQAWRDRVMFAGSGMDPDRAEFISIDELLAGEDAGSSR